MDINRRKFIKNAALVSYGLMNLPFLSKGVSQKKITLLGDSIRLGYQWNASLYLEKQAEVWGPDENTYHTVQLLLNAHQWIRDKPVDIIHVNAGLHDIKCIPFGSRNNLIPVEQYADNVERLVKYIHRVHPAVIIIWATITPVLDERANQTHEEQRDFSRYNEDVIRYNRAASLTVQRMGIPVNDLYDYVMSGEPERIMLDDGIHFTDTGYQYLGEQVANAVKVFL